MFALIKCRVWVEFNKFQLGLIRPENLSLFKKCQDRIVLGAYYFYFRELNISNIHIYSSQMKDLVWTIYNSRDTVFTLPAVAMLMGESNFQSINQKLNYHVRAGKLLHPRKGIYAKPTYNPEELACLLYTPSYISLEYVLQKSGVIFQYDSRITTISYLSRSLFIDNHLIAYRKIKNELLVSLEGIEREGNVNIATPERAFLDTMYLNSSYYFDNIHLLSEQLIRTLLPIYNSSTLTNRVNKLLENGGHQQA